jgi:hypothetical protein
MQQHAKLGRRRSDRLSNRVEELQTRLTEINQVVHTQDPVLDAELRAIHAALPFYKEALGLELEQRKSRKSVRMPSTGAS